MCGIWAYISKNKKNNDIQELLKKFLEYQKSWSR